MGKTRKVLSWAVIPSIYLVILVAFTLLVHNTMQAQGASRHVALSGTDAGDCTDPVQPCATVQYAVDQANGGDLVKVAAGTYTGVQNIPALNTEILTATQVVAIDKSLTLRGGYTVTNWTMSDPVANPTTLDAEGLGRVLLISGESSPTIEGLRITGGNSNGLGGRYQEWNGETAHVGGGIYVITATVTLDGCEISSNIAPEHPLYGVANLAGGMYVRGQVSLVNSLVSENRGDCTGGVFLDQADGSVVVGSVFEGNSGPGHCYTGGALAARGDDILIQDSLFQENYAYGGGGLGVSGNVILKNSRIANNRAIYGGGVHVQNGTPTLSGNVIVGNNAQQAGGGISAFNGSPRSSAVLINNLIIENTVSTYENQPCGTLDGGSAILAFAGSVLDLRHNTIARNRFPTCADNAILVSRAAVTLTNNIVVSHGLAITVTADSVATLDGTLWGADEWANDTDWAGDGAIYTGTTNVWADPLFVDPEAGNYHILSTSPAVDAGVPTTVLDDIDGEARPFGLGPDIGLDEWATASTVAQPSSASSITVTVGGLTTTVVIPAGAVDEPTTLEYTALAATSYAIPDGLSFAGHAFDLEAYRDDELLPGLVFDQPVTITIHYSDADVVALAEDELLLETWNGDSWVDAACGPYDRHPSENWLAVPICHLSHFALFEEAANQIYLPLILRYVTGG